MPPQTTQMSATLKTAKVMNWRSNMSVTKPKRARSMRFPTAPARTTVREVTPKGWRTTPRRRAAAMTTDTTAEMRVRTQVWSERMEKAAPVFCT